MRPQFTARHDIVGVGLVVTHTRMRILGLSAYYHDSAAALVMDGNIVAAAQKERFSRQKHDSLVSTQAIAYCLREGAVTLGDIDYVAFYHKPFLKFERLLETYLAFVPSGFRSFRMAMASQNSPILFSIT